MKDVGYFLAGILALITFIFVLLMSCRTPPPVLIDPVALEPEACLPPGPGLLPVPQGTEKDCPVHLVCFTIENAAKIAGRDSILKQWVREAKARCKPVPPPDAGTLPDAAQ